MYDRHHRDAPGGAGRKTVLLVKASNLTLPGSSMTPPLGLLYLAATLRCERPEVDVRLLDTRLSANWREVVDRAATDLEPHLVGISALTVERGPMKEIARRVKARAPRAVVVAGGPHATSFASDCLAEPAIDAVVVGEGEGVLAQVLDAVLCREDPGALPGVYTRACPPPERPDPAPAPDVESLPLPAWDLVRLEDYSHGRSMSGLAAWPYAVISTSRGCPYRCTFCHAIHGKRHRARSPESVAEEVRFLERLLGRGVIEVLDDGFNLRPERARRILELFASGGRLRPAFPNGLRADVTDDATLDLLRDCRSPHVAFAIESASPRIQRETRKNMDLDKARRAVEGAARRGLYTNGFFMLGFPDETRAEMLKTIRYACETPFDTAFFFKVIPFPGTDLWERARRSVAHPEDMLDADYFSSPFNLSAVSDLEFGAICRLAYLAYYCRPGPVWRILRKYPNRRQLPDRLVETLALAIRNRARWSGDTGPGG